MVSYGIYKKKPVRLTWCVPKITSKSACFPLIMCKGHPAIPSKTVRWYEESHTDTIIWYIYILTYIYIYVLIYGYKVNPKSSNMWCYHVVTCLVSHAPWRTSLLRPLLVTPRWGQRNVASQTMAVSRSGRCLVLGSWLMMLPFGYVKIAIENGDL